MGAIDQLSKPVVAAVRDAGRPSTYVGHARELTSAAVTASLWPLGLAASALPKLDAAHGAVGHDTPVLLVHGYGANKSNWFFLRRHLREAGYHHIHTYNYNPLVADVPTLARRCVEEADALKAHVGTDRLHIVGHSLGGVVARYAIQVLGLEGVEVCATVASPHGGAATARPASFAPDLPFWRCARDLCPRSAVLQRLQQVDRPIATRFVAYHSNLDVVVPARRAMITDVPLDAVNIAIPDHGHLSIMLSRRLGRSIVEQLEARDAGGRPAGSSARRRARPATSGPLSLAG